MLYKIGVIGGLFIILLLVMGVYFVILSTYSFNLDSLVFGLFCLGIGTGAFALHSRKKVIVFDKVREIFK